MAGLPCLAKDFQDWFPAGSRPLTLRIAIDYAAELPSPTTFFRGSRQGQGDEGKLLAVGGILFACQSVIGGDLLNQCCDWTESPRESCLAWGLASSAIVFIRTAERREAITLLGHTSDGILQISSIQFPA